MNRYEAKRLEMDFMNFANRNFERPSDCRNIDQIRFYVRELCVKIEDYERRFNHVPSWAYTLLAQYNNTYNKMVHVQFEKMYS